MKRRAMLQTRFRKSCKEIIHDLLEDNTSEWNYNLMKARKKRREEIKNATKDKI